MLKNYNFSVYQSQNFRPTYLPHKRRLKLLYRGYMLWLRDLKLWSFIHAYHFKFQSFKHNLSQCLALVTPSIRTTFSSVMMLKIWTFGNHQVNIRNQAFQVRPINFQKLNTYYQSQPIKFLNLNTYDQGDQLPPPHAPTLKIFHNRRSWSWTGHQSHLAKTTSSWHFFPWSWKIWRGTNSWRE